MRLFREYAARDSLWIIPSWFSFWDLAKKLSRVKELQTFWYDKSADIYVDSVTENPQLSFTMHYWDKAAPIDTLTLWAFNADNMMIAARLAMRAWATREQCVEWLTSFPWLPWRQELVVASNWVTAMIDFALTPDWLTTLYKAVRSLWFKKQIAVFGATWNRDQWKRPVMWEVATKYNDYVIVTEDENYHEDGMIIMKAVEWWIDQNLYKETYELVQDRTDAIRRGLEIAQPWDIVIITWMANFTSRAMNQWSIPRDEKEVIKNCMKELWIL